MDVVIGVAVYTVLSLTIIVGFLGVLSPILASGPAPVAQHSEAATAAAARTYTSLVALATIAEESWKQHAMAQQSVRQEQSDHALPWIIPPSIAPTLGLVGSDN